MATETIQQTETEQQYRAEILRERLREGEEAKRKAAKRAARAEGSSPRINPVEGFPMLGFAIIVDGLQFIVGVAAVVPIVGWLLGAAAFVLGWIISIIVGLIFFLILTLKGISMREARGMRILGLLGGSVLLESIVSLLPTWTLFVISVLFMEYVGNRMLHQAHLQK